MNHSTEDDLLSHISALSADGQYLSFPLVIREGQKWPSLDGEDIYRSS